MAKHSTLTGADLHNPKAHASTHAAAGSDPINVTGLVGTHVHYVEEHAVTAGDVSAGYVDLVEGTYTVGNKSLDVYINGVLTKKSWYTETSSSRVTFVAGTIAEGDDIEFHYRK